METRLFGQSLEEFWNEGVYPSKAIDFGEFRKMRNCLCPDSWGPIFQVENIKRLDGLRKELKVLDLIKKYLNLNRQLSQGLYQLQPHSPLWVFTYRFQVQGQGRECFWAQYLNEFCCCLNSPKSTNFYPFLTSWLSSFSRSLIKGWIVW